MSEFCVNWVSFKNSISEGFSRLQQNGEFVDMTLAAEGHLVQVHKNIVALASPYLKAMIQSVTCQHPVIFLNKISYKILGFILEYIYTGEVKIPSDVLPVFIEACKELHLNGVENLDLPATVTPETLPENLEPSKRTTEPLENKFAAHITIDSTNYNVEVVPTFERDMEYPILDNEATNTDLSNCPIVDGEENLKELMDETMNSVKPIAHKTIRQDIIYPILDNEVTNTDMLICPLVDKEENLRELLDESINNVKPIPHKTVRTILPNVGGNDKSQHYSISNRGSLQLLLNRYMYYCHHHSCEGRRRRWRCIDYRKMQCPAVIDTYDDNIIKRSEMHCHSYHDAKILRKFKSKTVFTTLLQAEEKVTPKKRVRNKVNKRKVTSNL